MVTEDLSVLQSSASERVREPKRIICSCYRDRQEERTSLQYFSSAFWGRYLPWWPWQPATSAGLGL